MIKKARSGAEERTRRQRLDYQPSAKPIPVAMPVPVARPAPKQRPVTLPGPEADLLENCRDIQQSLRAVTEKYSLDSFTIASSDGLVIASSGGDTAQTDAAQLSRHTAGLDPAGVALFNLDHKGSELTGIIRSPGGISPETRKHIESDTKDILNRWI